MENRISGKTPEKSKKGTKNGTKDGIKDGAKELTERQSLILKLIKADGTITTHNLTQKTGMSQRTLLRELAALQKKGVLTREGGRKEGRWIIKDRSEKQNRRKISRMEKKSFATRLKNREKTIYLYAEC